MFQIVNKCLSCLGSILLFIYNTPEKQRLGCKELILYSVPERSKRSIKTKTMKENRMGQGALGKLLFLKKGHHPTENSSDAGTMTSHIGTHIPH